MPLVASVDYAAKRIYLSVETADAVLDTLEIYQEVRALRRLNEPHRRYKPMIDAGGNIPKIPGVVYTQPYVRLLNGCRIVPHDSSHKITLIRDTFTDDGLAGRDCFDRTPLNPGTDVDIDVLVDKVEVRVVDGAGGGGLTPEQAEQIEATFYNARDTRNVLYERLITDFVDGKLKLYNQAGVVTHQGTIYHDIDGAEFADGTAPILRRDAMVPVP